MQLGLCFAKVILGMNGGTVHSGRSLGANHGQRMVILCRELRNGRVEMLPTLVLVAIQ